MILTLPRYLPTSYLPDSFQPSQANYNYSQVKLTAWKLPQDCPICRSPFLIAIIPSALKLTVFKIL